MEREIELRRHTDADEDVLTSGGAAAAVAIGARLRGSMRRETSRVSFLMCPFCVRRMLLG